MSDHATLRDAIIHFSAFHNCKDFMVALRWPEGKVKCPTCGAEKVTWLEKRHMWKCYAKHPSPNFSLKTGTIFEDSPIALEKWLPAVWMILNDKNGISSYEIHRGLGVTQKTAWFMLHRIRLAMQDPRTGGKLDGIVEVDDTLIGGKARNMHKDRKAEVQKDGRNTGGKTTVIGALERDGQVRATVAPDRTAPVMRRHIRQNVREGAHLMSDEAGYNWRMPREYQHDIINHAEEYVRGNVHTNGIENFWALLKRGLHGTYISVEPFHLFRYVDEQAFRYNNRHTDDVHRFIIGMRQAIGRRITYKELTGKDKEVSHG